MAVPWDLRHPRPNSSNQNSYHGQTAVSQPPSSEHLGNTRLPNFPNSDYHPHATPDSSILHLGRYEGYTIKPDDIASSEKRWSLPPRKPIPATQEDLHTEVIRQRQSGRTACRELEDCHGPKRQYIDRLIMERNASTSLGHFEVAQLRLERIPRESRRAYNRSGGRNYDTHDYKHKESTKPKLKTVYMHIILQFMKNASRSLVETASDNYAPRNPSVGETYHGERQNTSEEDFSTAPITPIHQPPLLHVSSQRPTQAREYRYTTDDEQSVSPSPSCYISRGTQTASPAHAKLQTDEIADDAPPGDASSEESCVTYTNVEEGIPRSSPSSDDEVVSTRDSPATSESENESTGKESKGIDEYEKPPWFQNLQPGLLLLHIPNDLSTCPELTRTKSKLLA